MSFDVQVETAPETQFESTLTEGIQAEANLRVRGTVSNPPCWTHQHYPRQADVFRHAVHAQSGHHQLLNPVKVEPILNIDLETKARASISSSRLGAAQQTHPDPRSDPPLQFSEIVALLAQGRAPASDRRSFAGRSTASFGQAGASRC